MRASIGLLAAVLVAVPTAPAAAGDYGCNSRYYPSAPYYGPRYYYPPGYYPATVSAAPYAAPCDAPVYPQPVAAVTDTLYRVAPDLAQARLAQEAANAAINQYKAEVEKQADKARQLAADARQAEFQNQLLMLLVQQRGGAPGFAPPAAPPVYVPPVPPAAYPTPPPAPPAIPPAAAPRAQAGPGPEEVARKGVVTACMPCHATNNPKKLTDLTDPGRLAVDKWRDVEHRMISDDPEVQMPPADKPRAPIELVNAFHGLINQASRKK